VWVAFGPALRVRAFSSPELYFKDPANGGSGGRWFTGSLADGYGCAVCHTGAPPLPLYVEGLPPQGYVPGAQYDLRLWWPEFSLREQTLLANNAANDPTMALVAELVAETGKGSGKLEIQDNLSVGKSELCARPPDGIAANMWTVRPKELPSNIDLECTASDYNQRCLVTVDGCGAREMHVKWTAPPEWQGTIWFNAGLVTTDQSSGRPDADGATELAIPLSPAASTSANYTEKLHSGCSVRAFSSPAPSAGWLALSAGLLSMRAVRRRHQPRRLRP
jgi:hypothetical protein